MKYAAIRHLHKRMAPGGPGYRFHRCNGDDAGLYIHICSCTLLARHKGSSSGRTGFRTSGPMNQNKGKARTGAAQSCQIYPGKRRKDNSQAPPVSRRLADRDHQSRGKRCRLFQSDRS